MSRGCKPVRLEGDKGFSPRATSTCIKNEGVEEGRKSAGVGTSGVKVFLPEDRNDAETLDDACKC